MLSEVPAREEFGSDSTLLFRGLRLRMGVHRGRPNVKIDQTTGRMDYFGPAVNKAARVAGAAAGGQIVMSRSTFDAMVKGESSGVGFSLHEDAIPGLSLTPIDRRTDRRRGGVMLDGVSESLPRSRRRATLPPSYAVGRGRAGGASVFRVLGADTWSAHPQTAPEGVAGAAPGDLQPVLSASDTDALGSWRRCCEGEGEGGASASGRRSSWPLLAHANRRRVVSVCSPP
eukprot:tig00021434_g21350.t1